MLFCFVFLIFDRSTTHRKKIARMYLKKILRRLTIFLMSFYTNIGL